MVMACIVVAALAGCSDQERRGSSLPPGTTLFVDDRTTPYQQALALAAAGRDQDAALIRRIAERPLPTWLSHETAVARDEAGDVVTRAQEAGQLPVVVVYNLPRRDCGGHSAGGAASDEAYRDWLTAVAQGIGKRPVIVILEPDAVAHTLDGCMDSGVDARLSLLAWAVGTLKENPVARVYLDAGNPGWISDVGALTEPLRRAGIERADGFSLNVSNFYGTGETITYGERLSAQLGGARFVIDTSRNGNGPYGHPEVNGAPSWCNPPGRALGTPPTMVDTGSALVDALLWIKIPGESDGACRPGEPDAGSWWPEYALELARNAGE
jgi:endoglucanase